MEGERDWERWDGLGWVGSTGMGLGDVPAPLAAWEAQGRGFKARPNPYWEN